MPAITRHHRFLCFRQRYPAGRSRTPGPLIPAHPARWPA